MTKRNMYWINVKEIVRKKITSKLILFLKFMMKYQIF